VEETRGEKQGYFNRRQEEVNGGKEVGGRKGESGGLGVDERGGNEWRKECTQDGDMGKRSKRLEGRQEKEMRGESKGVDGI